MVDEQKKNNMIGLNLDQL